VQAEREDWNYLHFHPAGGYTYKQKSEELFELFQTRDPKLDLFQAFFQTFPDLDEFAIKDLYAKHPTKPDRWLYKGRADDLIVLSNGEKLNPLDMEACINEHPAVKASLVVRSKHHQFHVALIDVKTGRPRQIPNRSCCPIKRPVTSHRTGNSEHQREHMAQYFGGKFSSSCTCTNSQRLYHVRFR